MQPPRPVLRIAQAAALATALSVTVAACSSSSPGSSAASATSGSAASTTSQALNVAYANIENSSSTFDGVTIEIKADAAKLGWTVETYDNNLDAATTVSNARLMADGSADVVADWVTADNVQASVSKIFSAAGKKCLSVNVAISGCPLLNISNQIYGEESGTELAQAATKAGWTAENTDFIAIGFADGGSDPATLISSASQSFSENFKGFEKITASQVTSSTTKIGSHFLQIDGGGTINGTNTALKDALQDIPAGTHLAIVTVNDDSGLGALSALTSAARNSDAFLASTGSSAAALQELRTNKVWVSEGAVYFNYWAAYLLAMAKAEADGDKLPALTVAPQNSLTKQNVNEYFKGADPIKAPSIDASAEYLEKTGVLQKLGIGG